MNLVQVRILGLMHCSKYGTLATNDILRCSPEYAKHLVNELKFAEYIVDSQKADADLEVELQEDLKQDQAEWVADDAPEAAPKKTGKK